MASSSSPLVSVSWLTAQQQADGWRPDLAIVDCRWYLDRGAGVAEHAAGHLPGAVFADLDHDLSAPPGADGRHPLPEPHVFAATMERLGISDTTTVVVYDDCGGTVAGRLWWMLDALGRNVRVLDGGIDAWPGPLETGGSQRIKPGVFTARAWPDSHFVTANDVATRSKETVLLDARSSLRYDGVPNPIDPRFGHIPGAVSMPATDNLIDGSFAPTNHLVQRYADAGVTETADVIAYCGSGVNACADLLAMRHIGVGSTRLYTGSWSEWAAEPSRPVSVRTERNA